MAILLEPAGYHIKQNLRGHFENKMPAHKKRKVPPLGAEGLVTCPPNILGNSWQVFMLQHNVSTN